MFSYSPFHTPKEDSRVTVDQPQQIQSEVCDIHLEGNELQKFKNIK